MLRNEQRLYFKGNMGVPFVAGTFTEISSMNSNYQYVASIFLKFGEVKVEYFVYKKVFGFPPFYFITFL